MRAERSRNAACFTLLVNLLLVLAQLTPAEDFCGGVGSICSVWSNESAKCSDKGGAEYLKCICNGGSIPIREKCVDCNYVFGISGRSGKDVRKDAESACVEEGYTVGPIPSSVIEQQKERNRTMPAPDPTDLSSSSSSTSALPSLTWESREPFTITFDATGPTEPLPRPVAATDTETDGVASCRPGKVGWLAVGISAFLVVLW